ERPPNSRPTRSFGNSPLLGASEYWRRVDAPRASLDPPGVDSYSAAVSAPAPVTPVPSGSELARKDADLDLRLREAGRLIVAFSGGVDSSYLAYAAHRALGDGALAVTALSASYPKTHRDAAEAVVAATGLRHRLLGHA